MDGPTHRKIAPVFTAGATYLTMTAQGADITSTLAAVGVASAVSVFSANWADADLYASRPFPAIWAGGKLARAQGVRMARIKTNNSRRPEVFYIYKNKRHKKIKKFSMRVWATIFRIVGVRGHRVWQSHSPLIYLPLTYFMYIGTQLLFSSSNILTSVVSAVPLGLGLGYVSHLFGDLLTYNGLPLLPDFKRLWKLPIIGPIIKFVNNLFSNLKVARFSFAKASNKRWNGFIYVVLTLAVFSIIFPNIAKSAILLLLNMIKEIGKGIWELLSVLTSNYKN